MIRIERLTSHACQLVVEHLDDCRRLAHRMASALATGQHRSLPTVIGLVGTLGAGKTQWTKFFAEACGASPETVASPTYVLVHRYETSPTLFHLDAYRVGDAEEFLELGVEELFEEPAIILVEWADRFADLLPKDTLWIHFDLVSGSDTARRVTIQPLAPFPQLATLWSELAREG